jgi:hypothetical protein
MPRSTESLSRLSLARAEARIAAQVARGGDAREAACT